MARGYLSLVKHAEGPIKTPSEISTPGGDHYIVLDFYTAPDVDTIVYMHITVNLTFTTDHDIFSDVCKFFDNRVAPDPRSRMYYTVFHGVGIKGL